MPPEAGEILLSNYGDRRIRERRLAPRTRELYEYLFALHIAPHLGRLALAAFKPATIRSWRGKLLGGGTPEPQAVKAYCLLRAILNTAVREDEILRQNPCRIKGYDRYHTPGAAHRNDRSGLRPGRRHAGPLRCADRRGRALRSAVGQLAALRRCDVELDAATVRVPRKLAALKDRLEFGPPKSAAGVRVVALPAAAVESLREHLAAHVEEGPDALIFTGAKGAPLRSGSFGRAVKWTKTVDSVGLAGFHFHDLRHTGNTLAAASGASTRELMHRLGHATMRAALIYQHATSERDREIAQAMDRRIAGRVRRRP